MRSEFEKAHKSWLLIQYNKHGQYPDCAENAAWAYEFLTGEYRLKLLQECTGLELNHRDKQAQIIARLKEGLDRIMEPEMDGPFSATDMLFEAGRTMADVRKLENNTE